ncbi:calcium channel subunit Cch1 [Cordyceps militaris]|uniref:Calcium-channel protein CCH1 n=1 Tax=Cordyceps militaris TaxID=73501 RepID=A0A2H4SJG9_CORMI|nr:calcium channel subunit Cch1 [Cordyceps militaris]
MEPQSSSTGQQRRGQSIRPEDVQANDRGEESCAEHSPETVKQMTSDTPSSGQPSSDVTNAARSWDPLEYSRMGPYMRPESPMDYSALQMALPPEIYGFSDGHDPYFPSNNPFDAGLAYIDEAQHQEYADSDSVPLTTQAQAISGASANDRIEPISHTGFPPSPDLGNGNTRGRQTLRASDQKPLSLGSSRNRAYGMTLVPGETRTSRSPSPSGAFQRAGSIVRAMSQRVVNISGESEVAVHQRVSLQAARNSQATDGAIYEHSGGNMDSMQVVTSYQPQIGVPAGEKGMSHGAATLPHRPPGGSTNPLKGHSLGFFSPRSKIRIELCNVLVNPYTEPIILLLIVLQTILLAVESGPSVFTPGHERPKRFGGRAMDWAMLALFIVFTLEIGARIVVSGFVMNAAEYSTIDRKKGVRAIISEQYRTFFQPQRQGSVKGTRQISPDQPTIARSFTTFMHGPPGAPETVEAQMRFQLARRAFLRHSFNRLDFIAVVSFWTTFILGITGLESHHHLYIFKMLSCLRILRLLSLTHGTAIILRSLKKAAPLLVRVAFLLCFFWLLFAIIGVQSFKSSFSRQCIWLDPLQPTNLSAAFTNDDQLCGGYLNNDTGAIMPWVKFGTPDLLDELVPGVGKGKGFICPRGSLCLQQDNPSNGTVNFDNILQSLELVFVIMSANTFSDLMYKTMASDYQQAALFFGAGIMIMTLWLTNLLIAVITSSFQVIREESKGSAFTSDHQSSIQPHFEDRGRKSTLRLLVERTKLLFTLIVVFGLICQACRSARMSQSRERFIDGAEVAVTLLLDIEIAARLASNWRNFHRSWANLFDLGLTITTTVILIPPIRHTSAYWWLTVFQIVRAYRIVLAVPMTRKLILLVLGNAAGIANLMLFVFLMTFLVSIFASQLFRGEIPVFNDGGGLNRISFFTIYNSFLGMYQILSSENWTDILYSVTSYAHGYKTGWIGATFLIGWFTLSYFILVNMFIAVIQENFDVSEDEKRLEQVKAFLQRKELGHNASNLALSSIFNLGKSRRRRDPLDYGPAMMEMLLKDAVVRDFLDDENTEPLQNVIGNPGAGRPTSTFPVSSSRGLAGLWQRLKNKFSDQEPNPFYTSIKFDGPNDTLDPRQMARHVVSATAARRKAQREYLARHPNYNTTLYVFPPASKLRRFCQRLVGPARGFERVDGVDPTKIAWYALSAFIYTCVVAMVAIACVTTPLYQREYREGHQSDTINWFVWTDLAFVLVFTLEAAIKIIADGAFWTPNAYLRSLWGVMDTLVLVTLWINVITLFINDGAISRAVGAFKALRALRLLNVSNSARDTFHSVIIVGWWKIFGAAFVSISLLIPFAIYGLNVFNGKMISCNDGDNITLLAQCFGEYGSTPFKDDWVMLAPRVADNSYFKFDDFGSSLFTLYQIVSQEGWTDVSFAAQAITGRGSQPQDLAAQGNAMFFVIFNLMATVFVLTLFISVFMRNYTEQTGVAFLTAEQRSWLELRKLLRQISPSKSSYNDKGKEWKRWCHKRAIEKRGKWYQMVTVVLVLHLALLVAEFNNEPRWWARTREFVSLLFVLVYMSNIAIRIFGLGWSRFRKSSWDLYALVVVSGAFIATLSLLIANTRGEAYEQLYKIFLVAIILLLIPRNDALDQLFKTAAASLTVISNLLATWLVLFLVFAIAMTQAFSLTRFGSQETSDLNFRTVPNALILLFRMSLGEGWNQIMEDYAGIEPPLCVKDSTFFDSDCGSKPWARILFVGWNIISMYIFVNLFVSLIYESFSYVYQRSSGMSVVDRDEIRRFKEAWRSVDPAGTGYITKDQFPRLLGELSGIFQMRIYDPEDSVSQILDDVRSDIRMSRHSSIVASNAGGDIDLGRLNRRLAKLDVEKIRARRRVFNVFFEEVLVAADPDRGIAFSDVLLILAHYKIINDSKSLRLDEFLRRRARLQRVDEEIRRRTVLGFFDTLFWSRKFKQHMNMKRSARMTMVPQLSVPEILVDDEEPNNDIATGTSDRTHRPLLPSLDTSLETPRRPSVWAGEISPRDSVTQHPLSFPRTSGGGLSPPASPMRTSFQLSPSDASNAQTDRRGRSLSPAQARGMLDDSVWVESIRKSKTLRRSDKTAYRYGDLG